MLKKSRFWQWPSCQMFHSLHNSACALSSRKKRPGISLAMIYGRFSLACGCILPAAAGSELLQAKMAPVNPCPVLIMSHQNSQWYFPDNACGESEFQLDKDLRFKQFAFQASGLPAPVEIAPFGRCNLEQRDGCNQQYL
jgi:hypothetical protein